MKKLTSIIALTLFLGILLKAQDTNTILLKGKIFNKDTDTLLLLKSFQDTRYQGIEIPINPDNTFQYELAIDNIEEYSFIFKSEYLDAFRPIYFYPDKNTISFKLYPSEEFDKNKINGSYLTDEKAKFYKAKNDTFRESTSYWGNLLYKPDNTPSEKRKAQEKIDSLQIEMAEWQHNYFSAQPNIVGFTEYVRLLKRAKRIKLPSSLWEKYQSFWIKAMPNHPNAKTAMNIYVSLIEVQPGGNYIDFKTIDETGKSYHFSDLQDNSPYTLLDLWAPWCGPCIKKSRNILANYTELNAKGLQVVGVIGGIKEMNAYHKTIAKHSYPWTNYVEINNENKIWEKYGIANAGGSQFLINPNGKIIAINPNLDEINLLLTKE